MLKLSFDNKSKNLDVKIDLPSSKSQSNRLLIIDALCEQNSTLENLSQARDTQTMIRLLKSQTSILDVLDAGTTMRFLTAYTCVKGIKTILTGSKRMKERPIHILVEALQKLGAEIDYLEKEGYPPISIKNFEQKQRQIDIRGDVSSQYISALVMIAPLLPLGLELNLVGIVNSKSYIKMTLALMQDFGIQFDWNEENQRNLITIEPQKYQSKAYYVESDWSAASYWYALVALADDDSKVYLTGLKEKSLQGDSVLVEMMKAFGVHSTFDQGGVLLQKKKNDISHFEQDFSDCPDIAQTLAVVCACKGISAHFTGLESLKIKETDRLIALQNELQKFGAVLHIKNDSELLIEAKTLVKSDVPIETYEDHRMAMAFAPLFLDFDIEIENPEVVVKSYPSFWEDWALI
jgi:3-phosphoshikimate 1-carboxyvinyltransferase